MNNKKFADTLFPKMMRLSSPVLIIIWAIATNIQGDLFGWLFTIFVLAIFLIDVVYFLLKKRFVEVALFGALFILVLVGIIKHLVF